MVSKEFRLEGSSLDREQLVHYCRKEAQDPATPGWRRELYAFILEFLDQDGEGIIQLTSGTTGDPKRLHLEREKMILSARRTLSFLDIRPGESALLCLPVKYIAGKMMVIRALVGGLDLIPVEPSGRPLESVSEPISFCAMVPLQLHETLSQGDDLSRVERLLIGGGELHAGDRKLLSAMERPAVWESFGMSETYTHFALRRINGDRPDSAFRMLEGVRISRDRRGCLAVSVEGITEGRITTSDLVELVDGGSGFRWLGRADNVINTGGIKIIPEILEAKIAAWLDLDCFVIPEPDERLGDRLVLLVEYTGQTPPLDTWMIKIRDGLSSFEIPKRIVVTGRLPRNEHMKPDRRMARSLI